MGRLREIVFDCERPAAVARFWAAVIDGYAVRPYDEAEIKRLAAGGLTPETDPTVMVHGPGPTLCFQHVPGRNFDNNRVHLDIAVIDRGKEAERLCDLGASVWREGDGYTVMRDPEGNQFCLVERE
jgi:Glyoxalase-like domain